MSSTVAGARAPVTSPEDALGVDLGVKSLIVATPAATDADLSPALDIPGDYLRAVFDEFRAVTRRLQATPVDTTDAEARVFIRYKEALDAVLRQVVRRLVAFVDRHGPAVVGVEQLGHRRRELQEFRDGSMDCGTWVLPILQEQVVAALEDLGVDVELVNPALTTKNCHACGVTGGVKSAKFCCHESTCPVDVVDRDRSAAATIAHRAVDQHPTTTPG